VEREIKHVEQHTEVLATCIACSNYLGSGLEGHCDVAGRATEANFMVRTNSRFEYGGHIADSVRTYPPGRTEQVVGQLATLAPLMPN
jgi:hypothetical protein